QPPAPACPNLPAGDPELRDRPERPSPLVGEGPALLEGTTMLELTATRAGKVGQLLPAGIDRARWAADHDRILALRRAARAVLRLDGSAFTPSPSGATAKRLGELRRLQGTTRRAFAAVVNPRARDARLSRMIQSPAAAGDPLAQLADKPYRPGAF